MALWTLHQEIEYALLMGNRDKNFSKAIQRAANQLSGLAGTPAPFPPEPPKNDSDDSNQGRNARPMLERMNAYSQQGGSEESRGKP